MKKDIKILAIESSCDETAAAVIGADEKGGPVILSSVVSSQVDLHAKTGGVVPEVASRAHMEAIVPIITEALIQSGVGSREQGAGVPDYTDAIEILQNHIDYIAVTAGPGLIGSLLVGFNAAKTIAYSLDKPIIPVNHIEGHIYSPLATTENKFEFPVLTLTVSGGHTSLTLLRDHVEYETIGGTKDDAAGEAFDKVAKLLGLGYPGGPEVSKLASEFRSKNEKTSFLFPRPILNDGTFNFSFSGLKTAVLQHVLNVKKERELTENDKEEICAAFEDASVDVLTTKAMRAVEKYKPKTLVLAGGVAANKRLREILKQKVDSCESQINLLIPSIDLCGDNAAMIGVAVFYHLQKGNVSTWQEVKCDSNLEIGSRS